MLQFNGISCQIKFKKQIQTTQAYQKTQFKYNDTICLKKKVK